MWACARGSRALALAAGLALTAPAVAADLPLSAAGAGPQPARVVSINLCTDQLAMALAAPGQLVSVSWLAADPRSSAMADAAAAYPQNRGGAEEVFLLAPDLVLAGTFTARATVDLLRRLGVAVVELPPVAGIDGIPAQILVVGRALGRPDAAQAMADRFVADLARLRAAGVVPMPAAIYHPNGYTTGAGTLADDILTAAGFRNAGAEAGVTGGGILPLERLVMAAPRMIVTSAPYPGASRSEEILAHPALAALRGRTGAARIADADWVCGTPAVLRALADLVAARRALGAP
ncbi:MAG: ABC transporter substrate-binding protein [Rhodobacterales bacterium]|nr:ABC transporter substrate-binding protein [Rhodobacterales bacterium]